MREERLAGDAVWACYAPLLRRPVTEDAHRHLILDH